MIVKQKMNLVIYPTGIIKLKQWNTEEGFYIEDYSCYVGTEAEVIAKGITLKECIDDYGEEERVSKKSLFSTSTVNEIIETFELSEEDINFITELGEWADF